MQGIASTSSDVIDDASQQVRRWFDDIQGWDPHAVETPVWLQDAAVHGIVGVRNVHGGVWQGQTQPSQVGLQAVLGHESWPLRPVLSWYRSLTVSAYTGPPVVRREVLPGIVLEEPDSRGEYELLINELAVGLAHRWRWQRFSVDVAGGANWVQADLFDQPADTLWRQVANIRVPTRDDRDRSLGGWASTTWLVTSQHIVLGVEGRWGRNPVSLFGTTVDASGWQIGGLVGWAW